jgi:hypothetical protein
LMKSKKSRKKWLLSLMAVMGIFLAGVYAVACGGEKQAEKLRDLEFAVIGPDETPQELAQIIEEKKNDSFRLTYTSGNDLYIAAGYGKQETGGYSGVVPDGQFDRRQDRVKRTGEKRADRGRAVVSVYCAADGTAGGTSGIPVVSYETKKQEPARVSSGSCLYAVSAERFPQDFLYEYKTGFLITGKEPLLPWK